MTDLNEIASTPEVSETAETTNETQPETGEAVGYSSDHYKWEMAQAIKSGNSVWLEHAKANYANALAKGR